MRPVCLDTHILIWGVQETSKKSQSEMIPKTKAFLKHLTTLGTTVMVPSVVVGEFLIGIQRDMHPTFTNLIERSFIIPPYDIQAAAKGAEIWQTKTDNKAIDKLKEEGYTTETLRADTQIIAIAVVKGASAIYSHDNSLTQMAEGFIEVWKIPEILEQAKMFQQE